MRTYKTDHPANRIFFKGGDKNIRSPPSRNKQSSQTKTRELNINPNITPRQSTNFPTSNSRTKSAKPISKTKQVTTYPSPTKTKQKQDLPIQPKHNNRTRK